VCDVIEPWEHGTAVRSTDHPGFWDYNCVRLEGDDPGVSADELAAVADRLQRDLRHRRFDIEDEAAGARLRPGFEALGWHVTRLVWLALSEPPAGPDFEEVPFAATRPLRLEWARADALATGEEEFQRQADAEEDVAARRGVRALIAGELDGYVTFLSDGETAEVEQAYVTPRLRGRGTGGALVAAAARAGGASETFIVADDEGDPKRLYQRLGFRPAWIQYEATRRPR
jgi:ribosomal protein S18 acetylase RimI-like enzyme